MWTFLLRVVLFASLAFSVGCGEMLYHDDAPQRLAPGYTPCGDYPDQTNGVICHPNQYCLSHSMAWCGSGCLSDDNCTEEQHCVKRGDRDVGTCQSTDIVDDEERELLPGYTVCGDDPDSRKTITCHPNHYCSSQYWGECSLGCVSEYNCTDNQICVKSEGDGVGHCEQL